MPYLQRVPNRLLRSEWATRIASELRIDEPVLREAFRRAAAERRSEVKPRAELMSAAIKPAERRLMQLLVDSDHLRERLAQEISAEGLHAGLETERIFAVLIEAADSGGRPDPAGLAAKLEDRERRMLFEVLFDSTGDGGWEEAESCLAVLRRRHIEVELAELQKKIEAKPSTSDLTRLLSRKQELRRLLADSA
jgi:hypothetical protein